MRAFSSSMLTSESGVIAVSPRREKAPGWLTLMLSETVTVRLP